MNIQNLCKILIINIGLLSCLFLDDCNSSRIALGQSRNPDSTVNNLGEQIIVPNQGKLKHFFFLPPLASAQKSTGTFIYNLDPVVQIFRLTNDKYEYPPVAEFTTSASREAERVKIMPDDGYYLVNLNTRRYHVGTTKTLRIKVLLRIKEKVSFVKELGYIDINQETKNETIPIRFRIEEGVFPIGELAPLQRAKISPTLLKRYLSNENIGPQMVLVNVLDDRLPFPELGGFEILKDYRPTLAQVFGRIANSSTLSSLAKLPNVVYLYENRKYKPLSLSETWQEAIGQVITKRSGYTGAHTAVLIIDDGGHKLDPYGGDNPNIGPNSGVIDLTVPVFRCSDVATPAGCRVSHEENPGWADPYKWEHATYVAARIVEVAPGVSIIAYDAGFQGSIDDSFVSGALQWALDHQIEYNIVAVNMSFGTSPDNSGGPAGPFTREDCPTGNDWNFQRLRAKGIVPIAGAGNDGRWQQGNNDFSGISSPACSPYVVSVGGTNNYDYYGTSDARKIWVDSDRAPFLDLLAPACTGPEYEHFAMGTSLSAPIVAAAWAIMHAAKPELSIDEILNYFKTTGYQVHDDISGLSIPLIQIEDALLAAGLPVIVYDNGYSGHKGGSSVGNSISAEDFKLAEDRKITSVEVDVTDGPASERKQWDGTLEWWLLQNDGDHPVNVIASGAGVNIKQRNTVEDRGGIRHFTVHFDFGGAIPVHAGETYWLALHLQDGYRRESVTWDYTGTTLLYQGREGGGFVGGFPDFSDVQYRHTSIYDKAFRIIQK